MFHSLKLRIYLFAFVPFLILAISSLCIQIFTLNNVSAQVSQISKQAIIETEKKRLRTVIDSSISLLQPYLKKPGKEGLKEALDFLHGIRFDNGTGNVFAYDIQGNRLMSREGKGIGKNFIDAQDKKGNYIVRNIIKAAQVGDGYTTYFFPKQGEKEPSAKYSYSYHVEQWDVIISTGFFIDGTDLLVNQINQALDNTKSTSFMQNFSIVAVISLIVAIASFFSVKTILNGLHTLESSVKKLAEGEGDLTTTLPNSSFDILDSIAVSFNTFLRTMASDINILKESCDELNNIAILSRKQGKELSQSSLVQIQETTSIAAAVEETSMAASGIADNANNTKNLAEVTEKEVRHVLDLVHVSGEELDGLNNVLKNVEHSIQELGGNVEAINAALSIIQGISEQTNLLALNAAIEAARAGELGRGFAVVADEVRNLAQRSQQSTIEIKRILEQLQHSSDKTIQDMSDTEVKHIALVDAMSKIIGVITSSSNSINNLTEMNVLVSASANEQSEVMKGVAKSVTDVATLAEKIGNTSESANEQFSRIEEQAQKITLVTSKFKT